MSTPIRITFKFLMVSTIAFMMSTVANAGTKRVDFKGSKRDAIDFLAAYDSESCHSLLTDAKVTKQTKNGKLAVQRVTVKADKGPCRGRGIQVFVITYQPKRGFKGKDEGSISYRAPPRRYFESQTTIKRSNKYIITVR